MKTKNDLFYRLARVGTEFAGSPFVTISAILLIIGWIFGGLVHGFTDTYQLIINTVTTIATFIMVFFIQATQNRDNTAVQLKLDEIIRVMDRASNELIDIEHAPSTETKEIQRRFAYIREPYSTEE